MESSDTFKSDIIMSEQSFSFVPFSFYFHLSMNELWIQKYNRFYSISKIVWRLFLVISRCSLTDQVRIEWKNTFPSGAHSWYVDNAKCNSAFIYFLHWILFAQPINWMLHLNKIYNWLSTRLCINYYWYFGCIKEGKK